MPRIPRFDAYLFDLDGTVYLEDTLIEGADDTILALRQEGRGVMFLSNKPISTRSSYADKLTRLGIPTSVGDVLNSSLATAIYVSRQMPGAVAYAIAEAPVIQDLTDSGIVITNDPMEADVLVASWDRNFSYRKLDDALQALSNGARFVATNPDVSCPVGQGAFVPDCGAIVAAIEACSGRTVDMYAGKPSPLLAEIALEKLQVEPHRALMVGDRAETDIVFGANAGLNTALVRTGAGQLTSVDELDTRPDFVLESVARLVCQ